MERLLWLKDFVILSLVCIHLTMAIGLPPNVNAPNYITVKEDVPIGSIIGSLTAFDSSGAGQVNVVTRSYVVRIENSTTPGNWSIILNTNLDRETTTSYILSFTADNCGLFPLTFAMTMFVQDVNDVHPMFENLPYNIDLKEDTPSGQIVYTNISASDPDDGIGGNVSYYMQDMTQHPAVSSDALFSIDVNSGNVIFTGQLDYETIKFYHYKVIAVDGGNLSSTTDLFINVTDVQDTAPYFTGLPYMFWLPENTPSGTSVYKVNAFDGDTGVPNHVTYSFASADPVNCSSFFGIDNATGAITVTSNSLDRDRPPFLEKNGICEIIVQAVEISTDPGPRLNDTANCTLTLTVNDVNDNVPTFSNNRFTATITENSGPGAPLTLESGIQLSVSDADQGVNSDFSLGLSNACLSITPTDVRGSANINLYVSNSSCFDFEVLETMTFRIIATSKDGSTEYADVDLQVINTNDNAPVMQDQLVFQSIPEDSNTSRTVVTIQATDADKSPYNNITFSLQGGDDMFVIDEHTGVVTVNKNGFDYETRTSYTLIVEATDGGGLRDSATLIVNITDVNDNEPVFKRPEYQAYVSENIIGFDRGASLKIEAADEDDKYFLSSHSSNIRYSFVPTLWSPNFSINETTGEITLTTELDYERTGASFVLTVQAADRGSPETFGFVNVTINVQDKNDFDPHFDQNAYSGNVSENAGSGISVINLHATDGDGSAPNNDIFYLISSGSNDQFAIDSISGSITTVGALDRETISRYVLVVLAVDRGSPARTATATVSIEVDNINDYNPVFDPSTVTVSVDEEQVAGFIVSNFTAIDKDSDADLEYSIIWSGTKGLDENQLWVNLSMLQDAFSINPASGQITVRKRIDRETLEMATVLIQVLDKAAHGASQTASGTVTIQIKDIDDNPPRFSVNAQINANISENSPRGTPLQFTTDITISDIDKDANSDFSLNISDYTNCLEVTPPKARREATVLIRVSDPKCFDYEIRQTLEFQIIATESTTGNSYNVNITLTILNENDNDPTFNKTSYNGSVVENVKDRLILQVHATDHDAGMFGSISYSLEGDRDRFIIDITTGEIKTKDDNLDRETKDTYVLTVVATDGGGRRSGAPLTITVTDANDEIPNFLYSYASRIEEGSQQFSSPLTLQAKDNDEQGSANSQVIYRIATCSPPICSNFSLDENSGLLIVNSTLDYERLIDIQGIITIIVEAIDKGVPHLTGNTTVQITVEDKNDVQPVFSQQIYTGSVSENAQNGQRVTQLSASDGDGSAPNNVVFYMLESGSSDNFRVNTTSGLINVIPGANLDREKEASYSLTVLTIDRGDPPLSSTTTVSILLVDENDEPPKFNEQTYEFSIYENASVGDVNLFVTANDPDTNHDLVYSLLLNESQAFTDRDVNVDSSIFRSWFNISSSTGSLRVTSTLDREKAEMVILKIAVTDRNGLSNLPQTAKTSLRITLHDVNDNKPIITPIGVLNVSEALTIGTEVTTLTAVDLDKDQTVSFFVRDTTSSFQVTSDGKVSVNRSLDRETNATLEFTVYAKDNGQPSMTSNITIHVNVIDKNDNDPEIANTALIFNVSEGAPNGTVFGVISATDKDEGPNAMITFGFSDIVNDFSINETTGELSVKRNLDRESLDVYKIGIIALDNPTTDVSRRASKQITINILDTNDNSPKFVNFDPNTQSYLGTVAETELVNSSVTKMNPNMIMATDKDVGENARLSYSIHSLGGADYFIINPSDGVITVNASIVGHAGLYNYTLTVTDHGNVPLSVSANMTIKVVDVNLNKPVFRDSAPHIVVAECAPIGTSLYTFTADDADQDKESNGKVIYILGNSTMSPADANHFHLNEETGILTSATTFDREIQSSFRISVTARDLGVPSSLETILSDVEIVLQDENDNPPVFNITRYTFEISESQMSGEVGTVVARDPDNDARTCYSIISGESGMSSYFNISSNTSNEGVLTLVKTLDREKPEQVTFVFSVTANDCSPSSIACKDIMASKTSSTEVSITVLDVNDNPPNFTQPDYSRGFMTTADFGHVIFNLQELITDPDTPPNRVHTFYPLGPLEMDQTLKNIPSVQNLVDPLILTKNGTVLTNVKFPADAQGQYKWHVMANDSAGNSTTLLKIYIVGEDKLVRITLFETEDRLRTNQFNIVRDISQQTGYDIVADDIKPFLDTNGNVDPSKSQLLIHAVTPNDTMLEASMLLQQMNQANDLIQNLKTSYQVLSIQSVSMDGVNVDGCTCVLNNVTTSFISVETTTSAAEVTTSHGHHDITCTESRMEFSIPLSSPHTSETATLSDPNCPINVTRTHVRGGVDLNSCGTTVQFQNDSVIFRNAIIFSAPESSSLGSSGSNGSVSQYQDIIPIQCVYNRIATVHLSYMPVVRRVLFTESGVGQFSFNIQQFWDASFTNMVSDRAYPLRMELDADVFIQLSVGSEGQPVAGHKEIGMEVQQCLVSPSSSVIEAQLHYYPLIQDGCPASSDVHIIPNTNASDSTVMRFRFRAVNFFDPSSSSSSSLVFVHCRMGLCLTGSCKPSAWSCLTPPARRVRRDVDQSKRAAHQLSTGPFLIMADEASTSSSSTTATVMAVVSTSVATVAIVIAAIALIALRRRRTTERN